MNLTAQGFELMLYGMGTVIVFLALLVFATRLMSVLLTRHVDAGGPESRRVHAVGAAPGAPAMSIAQGEIPNTGQGLPAPRLAAVVAAVRHHRAIHGAKRHASASSAQSAGSGSNASLKSKD
ncbi:MAG: OadG family transporter subunit [Pseudomonadota bacterium]